MKRISFKNRARLLLPVALLLVSAAAHAQQSAPRQPAVETVQLESRLVGRTLPYKVLLPRGYGDSANARTRYPVLYLLHGLTGHHTDWLSRTRLADYAADYPFIVVTPEGNDGWYTDSHGVPSDRYESYVIQELLPDVERRYRTVAAREGRAVAGLSMGGFGSLKFGIKYPDRFVFAGSMSGAVSAAAFRTGADIQAPFIRQSLVQTFGDGDTETKRANDLFRLVRELPEGKASALPFLYLDCGTEDPLQLLAPNAALAALLAERKVAHEYRQLPGKHDWVYWDQQVREVLRLASRFLKN